MGAVDVLFVPAALAPDLRRAARLEMADKDVDGGRARVGTDGEMQHRAGKGAQLHLDEILLRIVATGFQHIFRRELRDPLRRAHQHVVAHKGGTDDPLAVVAGRDQRGVGVLQLSGDQRLLDRIARPQFLQTDHIRLKAQQHIAGKVDLARKGLEIPSIRVAVNRITGKLQIQKVKTRKRDIAGTHGSLQSRLTNGANLPQVARCRDEKNVTGPGDAGTLKSRNNWSKPRCAINGLFGPDQRHTHAE